MHVAPNGKGGSLSGSALNCDVNPNARPPTQSVFELPLAITGLHQVEQGTLSLDQPVRFFPQGIFLPFSERSRSAKAGTSSLTILTFGLAGFDSVCENT